MRERVSICECIEQKQKREERERCEKKLGFEQRVKGERKRTTVVDERKKQVYSLTISPKEKEKRGVAYVRNTSTYLGMCEGRSCKKQNK